MLFAGSAADPGPGSAAPTLEASGQTGGSVRTAADPAGAPDGTEFHYITEGKIANVTALLTDRQGRLWVGTNDQSVAVLENGQFRFLNRENGWSDNSVRTIFQAKSGDVYVGTLGELCRVSEDLDTITRLEKSITGVWSIAENTAGLMACVDYSGQMFLLKNDRLLAKWEPDPELGRYACVLDDRGTLYAGSDGSGIYVVRDGKVIDILNEENGLSSRVILRMIPYREGCFVVTSNSLSYMEDNHARVLAGCGIIVVELEELLRDEAPLSYRLYNYKNGLQGSLTANAWVYVDDYGQLYLCSNIGVQRINMHQPLSMRDDY